MDIGTALKDWGSLLNQDETEMYNGYYIDVFEKGEGWAYIVDGEGGTFSDGLSYDTYDAAVVAAQERISELSADIGDYSENARAFVSIGSVRNLGGAAARLGGAARRVGGGAVQSAGDQANKVLRTPLGSRANKNLGMAGAAAGIGALAGGGSFVVKSLSGNDVNIRQDEQDNMWYAAGNDGVEQGPFDSEQAAQAYVQRSEMSELARAFASPPPQATDEESWDRSPIILREISSGQYILTTEWELRYEGLQLVLNEGKLYLAESDGTIAGGPYEDVPPPSKETGPSEPAARGIKARGKKALQTVAGAAKAAYKPFSKEELRSKSRIASDVARAEGLPPTLWDYDFELSEMSEMARAFVSPTAIRGIARIGRMGLGGGIARTAGESAKSLEKGVKELADLVTKAKKMSPDAPGREARLATLRAGHRNVNDDLAKLTEHGVVDSDFIKKSEAVLTAIEEELGDLSFQKIQQEGRAQAKSKLAAAGSLGATAAGVGAVASALGRVGKEGNIPVTSSQANPPVAYRGHIYAVNNYGPSGWHARIWESAPEGDIESRQVLARTPSSPDGEFASRSAELMIDKILEEAEREA